jgi:hypothetical protein
MARLPHVTNAIFSSRSMARLFRATASSSGAGCSSNLVHKARTLRLVRVVRAGNSRS